MIIVRWFKGVRARVDRSFAIQKEIRCGRINYIRGWTGTSPHLEIRGPGWIYFPFNPGDNVGPVPHAIQEACLGEVDDMVFVFPAALGRFRRGTQINENRVVQAAMWFGDPNGTVTHLQTNLGQRPVLNFLFVMEPSA